MANLTDMDKLMMTVFILTRDDAERVTALVRKMVDIVDEVLVLIDNRSDEKLDAELAGISGCRYQRHEFNGFGEAKRKGVELAKHDWIFSLDADEVPDDQCIDSIRGIDLEEPAIYRVKRLNHYCGRPIKACGWYPDYVIRIFHRKVANFSNDFVHESVKKLDGIGTLPVQPLAGEIKHYSFNGSHELLAKLISYSTLYADRYQGKPKSAWMIILRAKFSFFKFYILKRGFMYGRDGFIISLMNAGGVFHKHWRAAEIKRLKK